MFSPHSNCKLNTNQWEVGTLKRYTYQKESDPTTIGAQIVKRRAGARKRVSRRVPPNRDDPELEALVREIIGRVADKWTMLVLEELTEHGRLRFTRLGTLIGEASQKMLTKTVRQPTGLCRVPCFP